MDKVVVITGATSGLGLSHAIYLTVNGYRVFGTSRNSATINLNNLKEIYLRDHTKYKFVDKEKTKVKAIKYLVPQKILKNLDKIITQIKYFTMDVTSEESIERAIKEMSREAIKINRRGIDVIINNAGISFFASAEELSMEKWKETFETNFFGMLRVIKAILPDMRERKIGQIINTSSLAAFTSIPFQSHYSASKVALKILTEGLSVELKKFGIKVSTLLPSDINTNFNVNMLNISKQEKSNQKSIDIESLIGASPIEESSPYQRDFNRVWKKVIQNLIVSPPPITISRKVERIIRAKKPKINYKAGSLSQRFLIFLIRRIAPDELSYAILPKYYGL